MCEREHLSEFYMDIGSRDGRNRCRLVELFGNRAEVGLYVADLDTGALLFASPETPSASCGESIPCFTPGHSKGRCPSCPVGKLVGPDGRPLPPYTWEGYQDASDCWFKCTHQAIEWTDGRLVQMMAVCDITETKIMEDKLASLAFIDSLLGIGNANMLERRMADPGRAPVSLILYDICAMQKINEAYGRDAGDEFLRALRDWGLGMGLPGAELYRIGGDSFCLAVPEIGRQELADAAQALYDRFREPWRVRSGDETYMALFCDANVGVIPGDMIQHDEALLNLIDRTMKLARQKGRMTLYDEAADREYRKRMRFELSLKRCVREDMQGFEVYYQAIADPVTGTWCGFEALCRWTSPELGPVPPTLFIPEAERLELIDAVGLWALETAVAQCKVWGLDKRKRFILDVNLSAIQFSDERLADKIMAIREKYDCPGSKVCLEITESTQFTFTDLSLLTIQGLREKGLLVALDDFGTGYSNFNNLKSLPIDILKIERVFITNIDTDSYQQYLFQAMSELAHAVGMKLVAEGVENREQMEILMKNGTDYLQGYLFSQPLPASEIEKNLERFRKVERSFHIIRERKIDVETLMDDESGYILSPQLYRVFNQCMRILFYHKDLERAISRVLRIIGRHMDVSRTYFFLRGAGDIFERVHEWCAAGIESTRKGSRSMTVDGQWLDQFRRDGFILTSDIATLPQIAAMKVDTQAVALIPLWDDGQLLGFMGFDDCVYQRDWRPEEVLMLHNLSVILTCILGKRRAVNA
jgi:diguanylate cyclase (GGDEF)-like protein